MYLAQIVLASGRAEAAMLIANSAVEILTNAPVVRAPALAVLARTLCACAKPTMALSNAHEALELLAGGNGVEASEISIRCAAVEAFVAAGLEPEAAQMRSLAKKALNKRAGYLQDEVARKQFIERIPEHAMVARW